MFGDLFIAIRNNVIAARITNYLIQDDEENFDDLFRMKYNLVAALHSLRVYEQMCASFDFLCFSAC